MKSLQNQSNNITKYRKKIDSIDANIIKQLSNRIEYAKKIQEIKKELKMSKEDKNREQQIIKRIKSLADSKNIPDESIDKIYKIIFSSVKK